MPDCDAGRGPGRRPVMFKSFSTAAARQSTVCYGALMIRRAAILLFASLAAVLAAAVAIDVIAYGRLTLFDPAFLGGFAVIGIGILLADMSLSRDRAKDLQERTGRLTQLIEELENFSASIEAANIRSSTNEER